jgi:hypothetical protein
MAVQPNMDMDEINKFMGWLLIIYFLKFRIRRKDLKVIWIILGSFYFRLIINIYFNLF